MSGIILKNVSISPSWLSYVGCMDGLLRSAGLWKDELWKLSGLSGMAFLFVVHEACCPSSVTMYDWKNEHFMALDRLGIYTEADELWYKPDLHTFSNMQKQASCRIQQSIEQGKAVLTWSPTACLEFGLIKGFNDEERVYFVEAVNEEHPDPLSYENLGKGEVPVLYVQYIQEKVPMPIEKMVSSSLKYALTLWNKEAHLHPHYHCGRKAYEALLHALDHPKLSTFGLSYLLAVYQESKQTIFQILNWISMTLNEFKEMEEASLLYQQVAKHFKNMHEVFPFQPITKDIIYNEAVQKLLKNEIKQARDKEQQAMNIIEKLVSL